MNDQKYSTGFQRVFSGEKPIIGMVHLLPLPGSPNYGGDLDGAISRALEDAETLVASGVDALLVENLHDYPYYPQTIEPETVSAVTICALEVMKAHKVPIGINVLRNSWKASMGIAGSVGADFIRINVLTDSYITDQGQISGEAHLLARYRKAIGADDVLVLADVQTKHAAPVASRPMEVVAGDMLDRGGADGLLLSGDNSSRPADIEQVHALKDAFPDAPVILGSGMTGDVASEYSAVADGAIFGWGSKVDADMLAPVSSELTSTFCEAWKGR